jgi:hypothetical protein
MMEVAASIGSCAIDGTNECCVLHAVAPWVPIGRIEPGAGLQHCMTFRKHWGLTMNIVNVYDWFTKESMDAGLQATEWKQRETFLRLALMWATAAQECRKAAPTMQATSASS